MFLKGGICSFKVPLLFCSTTQLNKEVELGTLAAQNSPRKRKLAEVKDMIEQVNPQRPAIHVEQSIFLC